MRHDNGAKLALGAAATLVGLAALGAAAGGVGHGGGRKGSRAQILTRSGAPVLDAKTIEDMTDDDEFFDWLSDNQYKDLILYLPSERELKAVAWSGEYRGGAGAYLQSTLVEIQWPPSLGMTRRSMAYHIVPKMLRAAMLETGEDRISSISDALSIQKIAFGLSPREEDAGEILFELLEDYLETLGLDYSSAALWAYIEDSRYKSNLSLVRHLLRDGPAAAMSTLLAEGLHESLPELSHLRLEP